MNKDNLLFITALTNVLDYLSSDNKERKDFIEQYGDKYFDKEGNLDIKKIPLNVRSHIYVSIEILKQKLY